MIYFCIKYHVKHCRNAKFFCTAYSYIKTEYRDVRAILLGKYLFTVSNKDIRATSMDAVLVFLLLTANRYFVNLCILSSFIIQKTQRRNKLALNRKSDWRIIEFLDQPPLWKRILFWNLWTNTPKSFESIRFYKDYNLQSNRHIVFQSHQWTHQNNMWNFFKFKNQDSRTISMTSFWYLYGWFRADFLHYFDVSIVDFEHVNNNS